MSSSHLTSPISHHLYLHVPFCARKCSYCDFAIAVRKVVPVAEYIDAIMAELRIRDIPSAALGTASVVDTAPAFQSPPTLDTIYFGGGTPSKLGGSGISELIHRIQSRIGVDNLSTSEVTIEVNPEDVTVEAAKAWAAAGVNRASLGVQSFDSQALAWMHRGHAEPEVRAAFDTLRSAGIQDLSLDLIFALPTALNRDWDRDLDLALALQPTHISLYGLTVEPQTPLGKWTARGDSTEAPEERYEQEFLRAHETLSGAGFEHYEVSNYGLPGRRARHNSAYWSGVSYLGLGPAAHGFDGQTRRWNQRNYTDWLRALEAGLDPIEGSESIGPEEQSSETVYLGLRTIDGLPLLSGEERVVASWIEAGWGNILPEGRLSLTPLGWLRLDSIAAALTSHRSRS